MINHAPADSFAEEEDAVEETDPTKQDLDEVKPTTTNTISIGEKSTRENATDSNTSNKATSPTKEVSEPSPLKPKKPKNAAWQAMLQKEKEALPSKRNSTERATMPSC